VIDVAPQIEHRVHIRARPDLVYRALTSAEGWDAWFAKGATIDARPGGHVQLGSESWLPERATSPRRGLVLQATRNQRLLFQWTPGSSTTTVEIILNGREHETVVKLTESGYTNDPVDLVALVGCATGWGKALTSLKFYLEHGTMSDGTQVEAVGSRRPRWLLGLRQRSR
jgi:uncharacterized protein YndB with AHSA1/START domain